MAKVHHYTWLPSHERELLLKAALRSDQAGRAAWQEWNGAVDLDQLDPGSQRLLPLLYRNLRTQGIDHPWVAEFRKRYLDTWARNRILFGKISPVLQAFREKDLETLTLKGAALTVRYYRDYGLRPMDDFDFLVPLPRVQEAIGLVRTMGWMPNLRSPDQLLGASIPIVHGLHFRNAEGCGLDLHWHVLHECLSPEADQDFWRGAEPLTVGTVPSLGLNPTDELFNTCIHGFHWNAMPPIRWVADAVMILRTDPAIDWDRMLSQTKRHRMILPLQDALRYLIDHFDAPVPSEFLHQLTHLTVSTEEIREYKARKKHPYTLVFYQWIYYPRISRDTGRPSGLFGFIKYLQDFWGLKHIWQVPIAFGWRALLKILGRPVP
ncbi:MAG TPA: nucleotidyltransferase family protein [Anaerolineales bacterium]|nr:nucleotidyltransferase family protein [Anaerolineales bacterium]